MNDPEFEVAHEVAQQRDDDPDGDPGAEDLGVAEEPSDTDPEPVLNDDADDDFSDLEEGEDVGDMEEDANGS